jgi:uncharacterized protein (TIGR02246 family)
MKTQGSSRQPHGLAALLIAALIAAMAAQPAKALAAQGGAVITIVVPPDAEVFFDGTPTTQKGSERRFTSPPLEVGRKYEYAIRARWTQNGRMVERTRRVSVNGGADVRVDFLTPLSENQTTVERRANYQAPGSAEQYQGGPKDKAAIGRNGEAFVETFHKGDARGLAAFWTPDGEYTDQTGIHLKGREAIEKNFQEFFSKYKGLKVRIDSQSLHFVSPDVAIEEGISEVFGPDGGPPSRARFTNTHVKREGQWLLSSVRDSAYVPPGNYEHLRALEWAIGEWAGQADKGEVEHFSLAWSGNRNFIVAHSSTSFKTALLGSAQQWIGWDPLAQRLRSFVFDDSGAFGEGAWNKEGDKWTLKVALVLQDGKKATATYKFTPVDANTMAFQAVDRSVDGKAFPDTKELKIKRIQ